MLVIRHAQIYTPGGVIEDGAVAVEDGRIAAVGETAAIPAGGTALEGGGLLLIPGLIDMQCNGIHGYDVLEGTVETLRALSAALPRYGCTGVLPTMVSAPREALQGGLAAIAEAAAAPPAGAVILGAHMEGPWLNVAHHGAHEIACIRQFDAEEWRLLRTAARGTLSLVTLAPEAPGNAEAVAILAEAGTLVSLGHSGASYEQAVTAAAQGARMATHLFNAMGTLHHRAPGLAGAALEHPAIIPGIIPDGYHVHPALIRLAALAKGVDGLVVVTDAVPATGMPPGVYPWRGRDVQWDGETVRLADGGLAGSGLTPIEALRRFLRFTGLTLAEALPSMTSTPARLLGRQGERGAIVEGAQADLVLLTADLAVHTTLVGGEVVYRAAGAPGG